MGILLSDQTLSSMDILILDEQLSQELNEYWLVMKMTPIRLMPRSIMVILVGVLLIK